jgi:hypothetical protein
MDYVGIIIVFSIWCIGAICIAIIGHAYSPKERDTEEDTAKDSEESVGNRSHPPQRNGLCQSEVG